jgi:hypothetical protein
MPGLNLAPNKTIVVGIVILAILAAACFWLPAPTSADGPLQVQTPPAKYGLDLGAVELLDRRTLGSKTFLMPDGSYTDIIAKQLHYEAQEGTWADIDLTPIQDGDIWVVDKLQYVEISVNPYGIDIREKGGGAGIRWYTPESPTIDGEKAVYSDGGIIWKYLPTSRGVELKALVLAPRGQQTYLFTYAMLGGAADLEIDATGQAVSGEIVVRRPTLIGADGLMYDGGTWSKVTGPRLSMTFDDNVLPAAAFPYIIDPTTTFNIASTADDAECKGIDDASYPPAFDNCGTTGTDARATKTKHTHLYDVLVGLFKWDTSSLPDSATVDSATFTGYMTAVGNCDTRSFSADWHTWTTPGSGDYTATAGTDAIASTAISGISSGADATFALSNPTTISLTGYTGIRTHISGGAPTCNGNYVNIADYTHASQTEARLAVTYTDPSAAVTGTIGDGASEQEVRDGGGTIIITLTDATWAAAGGTFDGQRQNIIDGLDSAQSETYGWNNEVRDEIGVSSVVRTADTIATVTIAAADVGDYRITSAETLTVTVPASAISASGNITATPTITISPGTESAALTGTLADGGTPAEIVDGGETIIITLTNTKWVASGATFNAQRQNIIDGLDSNGTDQNGWDNRRSDFAVGDVVRTSDTIVTITLSASANYAIPAAETITMVVPAAAMLYGGTLTATPTFTITPSFVTSGTWETPAINLSAITDLAYCAIGWETTTPTNTAVTMEYSTDGGNAYSEAANGSCPLTLGSTLASISDFRMKATLTTSDATVTPSIDALGVIAGDTAGQTVRYELNTTPGLSITDRTGGGYAGTMSFPPQPSGISPTVGSMTALRAAPSAATALGVPQITSPVTGTAVSDNLFNLDETGWAALPGYAVVNTMATAGDGLPIQFIWYMMLGLITIMLGFFALNLTQSLMAAGAAMALGIGASMAIGGGLMPGWVIFVFIPIALGLVLLRPRLAI